MAWNALKHGLAALAAGTISNHTALQARVAEEAKTARLQQAKAAYEAGLKQEERQFELDKMNMQEGMRTERAETTAAAAARVAEGKNEFTAKENELNRLSREKAASIRATNKGSAPEAKPTRLEKSVDEDGNTTWIDPTKGIPVRTLSARGEIIAEYDGDGKLIDPNETADGEQFVHGIDDVKPAAKEKSDEAPAPKPKQDVKSSGVVRPVRSKAEIDAAMAKANALIAAGYDRKEVLERLQKLGITVKE